MARVEWLGSQTKIERMTVIDEENPERLVRARLRALGLQNETRGRFRYFNRQGIEIGDRGRSDEWLRRHLASFRPDLVILDTLMTTCKVEDVNSNSDAVRIARLLRGMAREFDCAVVLLHHERKQNKEHPNSSRQAMMGARQWAGQADAHMTLTVETDLAEEEGAEDGCNRLRRTFKWRPAEKDRDGRANCPQRIAVESEKDPAGRLMWMNVENEGPIEEKATKVDALAHQIGAVVQRGESKMKKAAIAAAVGCDPDDSTFKRALKAAEEMDFIKKASQGYYERGSADPGLER